MTIIFVFLFFFFLMLDVSFYQIFVEPDRAHKISSRPKMISPIDFFLQLRITFEQFYRQLSFQHSHVIRHGNFGWNRNDQVNVIGLNVQFFNQNIFPFTQHFYIVLNQTFNFSYENSISILRNKNNMIIAFVNRMRQLSIFHSTKILTLRQSQTYITTV